MDFTRASENSPGLGCVRRESWAPIERIRPAHLGDMDCITLSTLENVWVEDWIKPGDCRVRIYQSKPEDVEATDWEIVNCNK